MQLEQIWQDSVLIVFLTDLLMSDMVFNHSHVPPRTGLYQCSFLSEARWRLIYSQISQNLIMSPTVREMERRREEGGGEVRRWCRGREGHHLTVNHGIWTYIFSFIASYKDVLCIQISYCNILAHC